MRVPGERVRVAGIFSGVDLGDLASSGRSLGRLAQAGGRPPLLSERAGELLEVLHSPLIEHCPCGCTDPQHDPLSDHLSDPFREELS